VNYQVCAPAPNSTVCDTATLTVTGTANITAVNDGPTTIPNAGGTTPSVIVNDTTNGVPVVLGTNATLTPGSAPTPAAGSITMNPTTGVITVAPGTTPGTYTYPYTICTLPATTPATCSSAIATVIISPPLPIDAVNDAGGPINGGTGGTAVPNVLVNDTLNGAPATLGTVTLAQVSTTNPGVTLNPATGAVSVAPGTPAGTYTVVYRICEIANPTNCDNANVVVTVTAPAIVANDNDFSGTPISGNTGGTTPTIFGNDTLNGVTFPPSAVTATIVNNGGITGLTLNPTTGALTIPPGTAPGTYTVVYQICEVVNPTNCDTANVTIRVVADPGSLRIQKAVNKASVNIGDVLTYTLTVTNIGNVVINAATVVDTPPAGFAYVVGSARIVDTDNALTATGIGPITFGGVDIPVGGQAVITYLMKVGAALPNGTYRNEATVFSGGIAISNTAAVAVTLEAGNDPLLDQSRVLGKVFDDQDGDGWQDEGEAGIPGVRLATVEGLVIETDSEGRYNIEGLTVSNAFRGQNFVVKVDVASLPEGSVFTTENPLVRRITSGVPARFDFGVKLPPQPKQEIEKTEVKPGGVFNLGTIYFDTDRTLIKPQYMSEIDRAVESIEKNKGGVVRITGYADLRMSTEYNLDLAMRRAKAVYELIASKLSPEARANLRVEVEKGEGQ
jgi:uncharacterized repeat protein (TIGR01451 family)